MNPEGNQPWRFIRRTDAEAEAPVLWPPDTKSQLIGEDPDAEKDRGREEKGETKYEMCDNIRSMDVSLSKLLEVVKDRETIPASVRGVAKSWT